MSLSPLEEAARVGVPAALGKVPVPIVDTLLEEGMITKIRNAYQNVSAIFDTLARKTDSVPRDLDQADKILWGLALGESACPPPSKT